LNLAGRPIQRSGNAPAPPAPPAVVELGRPLRGVYVQAQGGAIDVSWNGTDWLTIAPGAPQHFWVLEPRLHVRATTGAGAVRYSVLGILV
jgi:hypothetical protein